MPDACRFAGLDLSYTGTGVARPDESTLIICTKPNKAPSGNIERSRTIACSIRTNLRASDTTHVIVEGGVVRSSSAFMLGELHGVVKLMLLEIGIPWVDVSPAALKKFTTGKGNSDKDQMIAHAIREFGFAGYDNNECDAWMLRCMALASTGALKVSKARAEVLGKVEWPWDTVV